MRRTGRVIPRTQNFPNVRQQFSVAPSPKRNRVVWASIFFGLAGLGVFGARGFFKKPTPIAPTTNVNIKQQFEQIIGEVYSYLFLDSALTETLNAVLDLQNPRLRFEIVNDADAIAKEVGDIDWTGDAYTVAIVLQDRNGQKKDAQYIVYIEGDAIRDLSKAIRILHHEFYHVKRIERSQASRDRAAEERATYEESISGLINLIETLKQKSTGETPALRKTLESLIENLTRGIAEERRQQASYLRTRPR